MIVLAFIILIIFCIAWLSFWLWFFPSGRALGKNLLKAALKAFKQEDYKKAKELFLQIPDSEIDAEAKYELGLTHLKLNEYDEAKKCFEQVLKNSPKNFGALFNLAKVLHFQKKYDEALEAYSKALKEDDKNLDCYLNIGNIYYQKSEYDKALEILEKAKSAFLGDIQVLFAIVKCKSELCDFENAEEYQKLIDEYIKLSKIPGLPKDFNISLAKVYAKSGNSDKAFEYCKSAVASNEEDVEAYKLLGLIQLIKKEFSEAKSSLSIALNLQSNNIEIHNLFSYLFCSHESGCGLRKCREKYYELAKKK